MEKKILKIDIMNDSELQNFYYYPIYPRDFKTYPDKGLINNDNGEQNGAQWTCFYIKLDTGIRAMRAPPGNHSGVAT